MPELPTINLNHPIIVWIGMILFILWLISQRVPGITGPLQDWWSNTAMKMRRTHADKDDADLAAQRRQIENLQSTLDAQQKTLAEIRDYQRRHDEQLARHRRWDQMALERAGDQGVVLDAPPPLYPLNPEAR